MKKTIITLTTMALLTANATYATESVPKTILLEAVVLDDGGTVLDSSIEESNIDFRIKNSDGETLFSETQENVIIHNGMIAVLVGAATETGIPIEALTPDGDKILEFQLEDQTISQETLLLASSAYSYYAEKIAGGIDSEDINDGQITLEDLSDDVLTLLNTDETGEPITTLDAANVTFSAAIANGTGTDMESLIQSIDSVITAHGDRMGIIETNITNIEADTSDIENRLTTAEGNITTLQTDVVTAQTTANAANTAATAAQSDADAAQGTANSAVTAAAAAQSDADAAQADADTAQSTANTARNEAQNAQDTADALGTRMDTAENTLDDHEDRIRDLERADPSVSESDVPEAIRPVAYGRCTQVGGSSVDDVTYDFYHITSAQTGARMDCDDNMITYSFTSRPSNTNYIVVVSPHSDADCYAQNMTTSGFTITCDGTLDGYDYVVYHNPDY